MIKVRNKKLSMVLVLAMLMTMFVGVGTASAAAYFTVLEAPTVEISPDPQDLGSVLIKLEDVEALQAGGAWLTVSLPKGCTFAYQYEAGFEVLTNDNLGIEMIVQTAKDTVEMLVIPDYEGGEADGEITISFDGVIVESGSGDIVARFLSNDSVFGTLNTAVIGKIVASAGAEFITLEAPTVEISPNPQDLGSVLIKLEDVEALKAGGAWLTISLPKGCTFDYEYEAGLEVLTNDNLGIEMVKQTAKDTVEILVIPDYEGGEADGEITIFFDGVIVESGSGDIIARFLSNDSVFGTFNTAVIGKIAGSTTPATANFIVLEAPTVEISPDPQDLGSVLIKLEDVRALPEAGAWLTVSLPKGCTFDYEYEAGLEVLTNVNLGIEMVKQTAKDTVEILVIPDYEGGEADGEITIFFDGVIVESGSGDIVARFLSNNSVFGTLNTAVIGKIVASAGAEFITLEAPTVEISPNPQDLGSVLIKLEDVRALPSAGAWLTVSLPKGCTFEHPYEAGVEVLTNDNLGIEMIVQTAKDTVEIMVIPDYEGGEADGEITISFDGVIVESGSGDIVARFLSNNSVFGVLNTAVIGKIVAEGRTTVMAKTVVTIGDAGGEMDTLVIAEKISGAFIPSEIITIKLPEGFSWGLGAEAEGSGPDWGKINEFRHIPGAWSLLDWAFAYEIDGRDLKVYMDEDIGDLNYGDFTSTDSVGRINIGSDVGGFFTIEVDKSAAEAGDVYVTVSSLLNSVETQDVLVAEYITDSTVINGDINGDGTIDSSDNQSLFKHLNGMEPLKGDALTASDVNQDGKVNSLDYQRLFELLNGTSPLL